MVAAYPTIASVPILGAIIDFASAVPGWWAGSLASNMAAIGSVLLIRGQSVGITPTTFTLITLTGDITSATRIIPRLAYP